MAIRLIMLGDIVGMPGMLAVRQLIGQIRQHWRPDLVIANAENAYNGSGLTPQLYHQLIEAGIDAVTLGDHAFRRSQIKSVLERMPNIIRPANLPSQAAGRTWMQLPVHSADQVNDTINVYVTTVLGRVFTTLPADDPFAAVAAVLQQLPESDPIVLVEAHAETTGEKQALAYHLDGQVSAVIGTHTHVATADARILAHGTAYITDIGMCGPHDSIIGRRADCVLRYMTTAMHTPFDVAQGDPRVNGVYLEIDPDTRRASRIERIEMIADPAKPPFGGE